MERRAWVAIAFVVALTTPVLIFFAPLIAGFIYSVIAFFAPVWLPILLAVSAWPLWTTFTRSQFVMSIPYSIIELKPGTETPRAARAMELVFYSLYHRTEISAYSEIFLGHIRLPWSFEVYAHAGNVQFFMHIPTAHRSAIESRIRAEFHDIDIEEAIDYSRAYHFDTHRSNLAIREFSLLKPDPYPIKTYVSHEKENDDKDVFNEFLEELISLGEGEHMYVQLLVRPHQRERRTVFDPPTDTLHEDAHKEIGRILGSKGDLMNAPSSAKMLVSAIESALKKPSFDCGVRALYMADKKDWSEERARSVNSMFDRFKDDELNSITSYDPISRVGWPLSEIFAVAKEVAMEYYLQLYRRRAFFSPPYYGRAFILNTEELATLFHFPHVGRVSALAKMRGLRLEPPENLPI